MEKNKRIGMLMRNNQMTKKKNIGMLKRHVGNTNGVKLNMKIFFFQPIEHIKTLKIEGIGYNVGGH
jgi:hypothetical protein